jgi:hypothetical protein
MLASEYLDLGRTSAIQAVCSEDGIQPTYMHSDVKHVTCATRAVDKQLCQQSLYTSGSQPL